MAGMIRRWLDRLTACPYQVCGCGHDYSDHLHYLGGRDCAWCCCRSYRTRDMSEMRGGPHAC